MPFVYNPPPGWPVPEEGWQPPPGWKPDRSWPPAPADWAFWVPAPERPPPQVKDPDAAKDEAAEGAAAATPAVPRSSETPDEVVEAAPAVTPAIPSSSETPDVERLELRIAELEAELQRVREAGGGDLVDLDDQRVLQEVGIYRYHHPLENAAEYKEALADLNAGIRDMVKARDAVLASDMFTFNNSLARGRKMTAEFSKLMLRAYNAEADNCVRSLRAGNVVSAKKRLEASVTAIAKLGAMMEMRINPDYHALRVKELELTADYLMKVQVEREEAREERERLREERRAEQELAAERARLDKEREHYLNALRALEGSDDVQAIGAQRTLGRHRPSHRAERLPSGEHPRRLRVRHQQPRCPRLAHREDRHDPSARTHGSGPRTRGRVSPFPVRRSRPVLLRGRGSGRGRTSSFIR